MPDGWIGVDNIRITLSADNVNGWADDVPTDDQTISLAGPKNADESKFYQMLGNSIHWLPK